MKQHSKNYKIYRKEDDQGGVRWFVFSWGGAWFVVLFLFVVGVCLLWLVGFFCLGFFQF